MPTPQQNWPDAAIAVHKTRTCANRVDRPLRGAERSAATRLGLGLGAALAAGLGAGLCCAGPLLYLLFGVSAAGLARLQAPEWVQALLAVVAVLSLAAVAWRLYGSKRRLCMPQAQRHRWHAMFWLTTIGVAVLLSYPWLLPLVLD